MTDTDEPGDKRFPSTRWSLVARAGAPDSATQRVSLGELLTLYLPALKAHLTQTKRIDPDHADDLLQAFVSTKFLEQNLATQADCWRGKFRTFVLTALNHFIIDQCRRESAEKRAADNLPSVDPATLDAFAANANQPAEAFDIAWARQVLAETVQRMKQECLASSRPDIVGVFECRILGPTLEGTTPPHYMELVERFGFKSPMQASNVLITAKRMFQRNLRAVIAEYADSPAQIEDEIRDLREILSRTGAGPA